MNIIVNNQRIRYSIIYHVIKVNITNVNKEINITNVNLLINKYKYIVNRLTIVENSIKQNIHNYNKHIISIK